MELDKLTADVMSLATKAGAFIREERTHFSEDKIEIKGKNDLVSYVDKNTEILLVEGLKELLPGSGFITEEGTASNLEEYNWIIDPLDGTTNFIHGIPCYAVSVGLEHKGKILLGVVYEVSRDECFSAHRHSAAYLNGKQIRSSSCSGMSDALIATGLPVNNFDQIPAYLQLIEYFIRHTHGVRRIGSAACDLCYLACGRVDAFFEYNLKPWDVAAGSLIAQQAGAIVTDFSGTENFLFGKQLCAVTATFYAAFQNKIEAAFVKGLNLNS